MIVMGFCTDNGRFSLPKKRGNWVGSGRDREGGRYEASAEVPKIRTFSACHAQGVSQPSEGVLLVRWPVV